MANFVVYQTVEDVDNFRNYTKSIADHFGSDTMAEHYLNGLIDWDGRSIGPELYMPGWDD